MEKLFFVEIPMVTSDVSPLSQPFDGTVVESDACVTQVGG